MRYLALSVPPFPYFAEGNCTVFQKGQRHPGRREIGWFDLIVMKTGELPIGEESAEWVLSPGELLILEPDRQHYPTAPCPAETCFYWLHFQTEQHWESQAAMAPLRAAEPPASPHFSAGNAAIYLPKFQKLQYPEEIYRSIEQLLQTTKQPQAVAVWEVQQKFLQLLQQLAVDQTQQNQAIQLAERIEVYLKQHYGEHITNKTLAQHFHLHENYLIRSMQQAKQRTPLEYLHVYRLYQARLQLLKTDLPIQRIAEKVGFRNQGYFATSFKRFFDVSPSTYRKQWLDR